MYLKALTLRGFKSFADKTVLELEPGVTVIVGPNGSGKSNIVDAIAWVLGAQGPKSLRGGKMDDVIFGGAGGRGPLGRAEVSLTIDNTDRALPTDYAEISITRLLYRTGDSEYAINGTPCRLLDIQELLSDTGVGRELHTIVGQGQLDDVLHGRPEDRRAAIEEAAGIYKHRRRKDRALRKLAGVEQQLVRLSDLVGEMRRQLKPLQQQAETARRAAEVQAELREVRLTLRARELRAARAEARTTEAAHATLTQQLEHLEAAHAEAQAAEAAAGERLAAAEPAAGRARETVHRLVTVRERLRGTLALAEERARSLAQPLADEGEGRTPADMLREADTARAELAEIDAELDTRGQLTEQAEEQRRTAAAALDAHNAAVAEAEHARAEAERVRSRAREQALQRAAEAERARARARERALRLTAEIDSLRQTLERARADHQQQAERVEELAAQLDAAEQALAAAQEEAEAARQQRARLEQTLAAARRTHKDALRQLAEVTAEQRRLESERSQARGRREAHEAAASSTTAALAALTDAHPEALLGPLAPALTVKDGYQAALAAALGADAAALALASAQDAATAVGHLRATGGGRATLLYPPEDGDAPAPPGGLAAAGAGERLLDHVRVSGPVGETITRLLADVLVAADLDTARALHRRHPTARVVTLDGELLARGRLEGGAAPEAGALAARHAAEQAATAERAADDALARLAGDLDAAEAAAETAAAAVEDAAAHLSAADARITAATDRLGRARADHRARERDLRTATDRHTELATRTRRDQARLADLQQQLTQATGQPDPAGGLPEPEATPPETPQTEADLPQPPDPTLRPGLVAAVEQATQRALAARMELSALTERRRLVADREASLRQRAAAEAEAEQRRAAAAAARRADAQRATQAARAAGGVLVRLERSLAAATIERDQLLAQVGAARKEVTGAAERRRGCARELEQLHARARDADHAHLQARMRDDELARRLIDELGADPDQTLAEYAPDNADDPDSPSGPPGPRLGPDELPDTDPRRLPDAELRRTATALERRLALLGRVNPLALEDYKALEERHAFLAGQLADLKDSRRDLLKVVRAVDARVREVFAQAYTDVAREFDHTFSLLFPGGEGRLTLTDPDDWLTTGVEIEARPPGKRLRRLSLLSGGERSLVALAFCFAIFRARPSPFYVLDEVEAALDDVNLQRFLHLLEDVRDRAQLLVVSHQRRTMEAADALYGVSMRAAGVSTVLSQKLRDRQPARAATPGAQ